jgi:SAM-dependent methyltransferase
MGCGTGKQLTANHSKFPEMPMIGMDLFHGMLQQARKRSVMINWIQGDSANPPFVDCAFDYITNQFSYHHVQDKTRMIAETYRILKPGGQFVITNLDPWSMAGWIVYTYFPKSRQRDFADFLPLSDLTSQMEKIGFCNVQVKRVRSKNDENLNEFLLYASQRHRTSQLITIRDREYEDGIARLKDDVANLGVGACVSSELCRVWVMADKPE